MKTVAAAFVFTFLSGCAITGSLNQVRDAGYGIVDILGTQIGSVASAKGDEAALQAGIAGLKASLKDPDSAKITNVRLVPWRTGKVVCGDVNAKNSYGGYVGSRPFVAGTTRAVLWDTSSRHEALLDASNAALKSACL